MKILNVCIKAPSGCHDVVDLRISKFWQNLQTVELPHKIISR
jgi:hypothetical protein